MGVAPLLRPVLPSRFESTPGPSLPHPVQPDSPTPDWGEVEDSEEQADSAPKHEQHRALGVPQQEGPALPLPVRTPRRVAEMSPDRVEPAQYPLRQNASPARSEEPHPARGEPAIKSSSAENRGAPLQPTSLPGSVAPPVQPRRPPPAPRTPDRIPSSDASLPVAGPPAEVAELPHFATITPRVAPTRPDISFAEEVDAPLEALPSRHTPREVPPGESMRPSTLQVQPRVDHQEPPTRQVPPADSAPRPSTLTWAKQLGEQGPPPRTLSAAHSTPVVSHSDMEPISPAPRETFARPESATEPTRPQLGRKPAPGPGQIHSPPGSPPPAHPPQTDEESRDRGVQATPHRESPREKRMEGRGLSPGDEPLPPQSKPVVPPADPLHQLERSLSALERRIQMLENVSRNPPGSFATRGEGPGGSTLRDGTPDGPSSAPETVVQIHIGRVEIRPTGSAAKPAPAAPRSPPNNLSLESYLGRGKGDKR